MPDLVTDGGAQQQWDLRGRVVTQLVFDPTSVRIQTWTLAGSAEVRLGVPFVLRSANGVEALLDPEKTELLTPVLALLGRPLLSLTANLDGRLHVEFGDASSIEVEPHPDFEAWESSGVGELEGLNYLCGPGGEAPWR